MLLTSLLACLLITAGADQTATETTVHQHETKHNATDEILKVSETADPAKVDIVKHIKRVNNDGSFTYGYEAEDGTFKIESRDVRGNVKGTFGYVDKDGEIKRVSYSSSSDSTPVPVQVTTTTTSTTTSAPMMIIRMNKTVSTTRRPLGTVVYPTRASVTTRGTVIQPIPRTRRPGVKSTSNSIETTTAKQTTDESNILHLYKPKDENVEMKKPMVDDPKNDLVTKQTTTDRTTKTQTLKPVYEHVNEKEPPSKTNTYRRELSGTAYNPHLRHMQQSVGDDSTDVYGSHMSLGTVRPLFTTTTPRPRLVPIHSLVAAREKIQQQYQNLGQDEQETTIEASTGRVFDQENSVTSNPVPVIHIPRREPVDDSVYHQLYRHPPASTRFRTQEYMRDNPGSPIPIGNQRPFLHYGLQNKILEQQYRDTSTASQQPKGTVNVPEAVAPNHYNQYQQVQPVTRIIPIAVDERGVPIQNYQPRYLNPYRPQTQHPPPPLAYQPRYIEPAVEDVNSITTPVSTRDLKRLLHILMIRQNRLQALMEQIMAARPPYQPLPPLRQQQFEYRPQVRYQNVASPRYQEEEYDYRYEQDRQHEVYYNQMYDQYESQRYIPKRRPLYTRPVYDTASASSNHIEEAPEYLPADVREALLLKMLVLAISPDFMPTPEPPTELTTAAPTRKQVRNIQILGEEGSMEEKRQRH